MTGLGLRAADGLCENQPSMHRPVQQLRHRHYEILRCVFEGQTNAAIARAFGCCLEAGWNIARSAPGQQLLAEWHARADQLTIDAPLRSGLVYRWLGRGLARLPEGPERDRRLVALAQARGAKARRRAQRAAGLPVDPPAVRPARRAPAPSPAWSSVIRPLLAQFPGTSCGSLRRRSRRRSARSRR
jgi:hypothetical protein